MQPLGAFVSFGIKTDMSWLGCLLRTSRERQRRRSRIPATCRARGSHRRVT